MIRNAPGLVRGGREEASSDARSSRAFSRALDDSGDRLGWMGSEDSAAFDEFDEFD
jgi:hypothetical protein